MSTRFAQLQAPKRIALAFLLVAGTAVANIPDNPTKAQIIASLDGPSVSERVALRGCKTKLEAAEMLQSIYQERANTGRDGAGWAVPFVVNEARLREVAELIEQLGRRSHECCVVLGNCPRLTGSLYRLPLGAHTAPPTRTIYLWLGVPTLHAPVSPMDLVRVTG